MELKELTARARNPETTAERLMDLAARSDSVDRLLAKHASASPELLEQLSHSGDRATRKAVAIHPNASKAVLLRLAPQFPGDFFKNPAIDWLLLEDPNLMFEIGGGVLKNVLKRADCPASFMTWAAAHGSEQEQLAVAMNPQAPEGVLQTLEQNGGKVAEAARQHANFGTAQGEEDLEVAFRAAVAKAIANSDEALTLAQWPERSIGGRLKHGESLVRRNCGLRSSISPWDYFGWKLLTDASAPRELATPVLRKLLENLPRCLRQRLAEESEGTRSIPVSVLTLLAEGAGHWVGKAVAGNPSSPVAVRNNLLGYPISAELNAEARNPTTTVHALDKLAKDSQAVVRQKVARNPSTPVDLLNKLAADSDARVRRAVAGNPSMPIDALVKLGGDSEDSVSELVYAVFTNPFTPPEVLSKFAENSGVWGYIARNPSTPPDLLVKLAGDSRKYLRATVALNPSAPPEVLAMLAEDSEGDVRKEVAANPSTPAAALFKLWEHSISDTRGELAGNPSTPPDVLVQLAKDSHFQWKVAGNPSTPPDVLAKLAGTPDKYVRLHLALNPFAPTDVLAKLANDSRGWFREAVARNPSSAPDLLVELAGNPRWLVRQAVAGNPSTPIDVLLKLAAAEDQTTCEMRGRGVLYSIRRAVAENPSTPEAVRTELILSICKSAYQIVFEPWRSSWWKDAVRNLETLDASLMEACSRGDFLYLPDQMADKACGKKDLALRLLGLAHRLAAPDLLAKSSRSIEWVERLAVARNPNTPPNVIESLKKDPNRLVSRQALATAQVKLQASRRQEVLQSELGGASANEVLVCEIDLRLKRHFQPDCRIYGSRWSRCLAPGQWLLAFNRFQQSQLELLLPEHLRLAMAQFWVDPSVPSDLVTGSGIFRSFAGISFPSALSLLSQKSNNKTITRWIEHVRTLTEEETQRARDGKSVPLSEKLRAGAEDPDRSVRQKVARNPYTPPEVLTKLAEDSEKDVRGAVAGNPSTPVDVLVKLAEDSTGCVRGGVARNPSTPPNVLSEFAEDSEKDVRGAVAGNPSTPVDVLVKLAKDSSGCVRGDIARNPSTPPNVLSEFAEDSASEIRGAVAGNPSTPADVLVKLAQDSCRIIREVVARNPVTPPDVLSNLVEDLEPDVRRAVAGNASALPDLLAKVAGAPSTAVDVLEMLSVHWEQGVRRAVAANPSIPPKLLAKIAVNPNTPVDVLVNLAQDSSGDVRRGVAGNPSTLVDVLVRLAEDSDTSVRGRVAENPSTPARLLAKLSEHSNEWVRSAVAVNPSTPPAAAAKLSEDSSREVRVGVAGNSSTPIHALAKLAKDSDKYVRRAVTENPSTPIELLMKFSADHDDEARLRVAKKLSRSTELFDSFMNVLGGRFWQECANELVRWSEWPKPVPAPSFPSARGLLDVAIALQKESRNAPDMAVLKAWFDFIEEGLDRPQALAPESVTDDEFRHAFRILEVMPAEEDKRAIARACKSNDWLERAAATYAREIDHSLLKMLLEDPVESVRQCAFARLRAN